MSVFKCKKSAFSLLAVGFIIGCFALTLIHKSASIIQSPFFLLETSAYYIGPPAVQAEELRVAGEAVQVDAGDLRTKIIAEPDQYEYYEGDIICVWYRVWWGEPPPEPAPVCLWPVESTFPPDATFDPHSGCVCAEDTAVVEVCWATDYCDAGEYTWSYYYAGYECYEPEGVMEVPFIVYNVNRCPSIQADPPGPLTVSVGDCVHIDVTGNDPDMTECGDDGLQLLADNMPPGATFVDNGGGEGDFDWCATEADAGATYTITFLVYDYYECIDNTTVEITVGSLCPPTGYPGAGTDAFLSTAGIQVYFWGIGAAVITLEGETVVERSEPYQGSDELTTIDMEIIEMDLVGSDPYLGPVSLTLNPQYKTGGQIQQLDPEAESPMESFFDVFVQLYTEMGLFYHVDPIRMQATIESIPPRAAAYEFVGEPHLPLYGEGGLEVGYIVNVKHVTQPYRDRFQSTAIFSEVEIVGLGIDTEVVVTGPAEAVRGDWVSGVVTTEMVEMELVGSGSNIGQVTITEDPLKISTGQVMSFDAMTEFPALSSFYINIQMETDYGTGFACAPVEATIEAFPPIGAEYIGPHDVDIVDEHGQVIGRIRGGFVHIPEEPLEPPPISTLPSSGWDCFDSEARITLQIGQDQEIINLTGPTIVSRSDPLDPGDGLPEVTTEIIFMALEGTSVLLGGPITIAECDNPSPGTIKQLKPELGLPAISDFTVSFDLLTPHGTYWGQQAPVIALIDRIPPENEEYQGPHPVVIVDPTTGEDIGQIIDFVHIPREPIACPRPIFPVPCPPCETGLRGDCTGDGTINVLDALRAVNCILQILPCPDFCWCDCNCDGVINVLDVLCIVNIILDLIIPDTGLDCMTTTAVITLQIGEMTVPNVIVTGTTVVSRGTPYDPDDGRNKIDTEILSMDLIGTSQLGDITVTESPDFTSSGYIQAKQIDRDFPAESFFDVYVEVDIPEVGTVHNEDPIPMRAKIDKIPPIDRIYYPPYEVEIPVYGPKGDLIGYIIHVTHRIETEIDCPSIEVPKGGRSSVIIEVPEQYAQADEKVLLPISMKSEEPIAGVQFTLSYNPHTLNPLTPQLTERSAEMELASHAVDGEFIVLIYSLEGKIIPVGKGPILSVPFEMAEDAAGDAGLAFKDVILAGEDCRRALPAEVRPITVGPGGFFPEAGPRPEACFISQCYPNPFNPTTDIEYQIPDVRSPVYTILKIHNILGQEVRVLVDGPKDAGYFTVTWDGRDNHGQEVASGVYFYRLQAGSFVSTKRMVLIR